MPISGVLLVCQQEELSSLKKEIAARPHAEVQAVRGGNLVVVTDTGTLEQDREEVQALEGLAGVIAAHVVFCNVEDLAEAAPRPEMKP